MSAPVWHLLTGELTRGGIGDYTRLLADALAAAGREVHVWSPDAAEAALKRATAHPVRGAGGEALRELGAELDRFSAPRRLLVQYAPQAWGMRGMNVPFCRWLLARRRAGDDVRVMFHEPFFPFGWQRPQRNLLAAVNRWMARDLLHASTLAYVSTAAWERLLRPLAPPDLRIDTLPIPSTIPFVDHAENVSVTRDALTDGGKHPLIVHFGTYGGMIAPMLSAALTALVVRRPDARVLLLGRGGAEFAAGMRVRDSRFASVFWTPGYLGTEALSYHLQAADVALQPYPDGADTRRTSLMACLANGVPTVSTRGRFTDGVWMRSPLVLVHASRPESMGGEIIDEYRPADRSRLGAEIRAFYRDHFAMEHTVARLLADEGGG